MLDNISIQFTVTFTGWQTCFWSLSRLLSVKSKFIVRNIFFPLQTIFVRKNVNVSENANGRNCVLVQFDLNIRIYPIWMGVMLQSWYFHSKTRIHHKPECIQTTNSYFTVIIFPMNNKCSNRYFSYDCPSVHVISPRAMNTPSPTTKTLSIRCSLVWFCAETHLRKYINYHKICTPFQN